MVGKRPARYYRCKHCGFEQKSRAENRVKCHRCKKTYKTRGHEAPPDSQDDPYFLSFSIGGDEEHSEDR